MLKVASRLLRIAVPSGIEQFRLAAGGALIFGTVCASSSAYANDTLFRSLGDALTNVVHDARCACIGSGNEIANALEPVAKFERNMISDLTKGPGSHNDLVGREGWLRQRLGF